MVEYLVLLIDLFGVAVENLGPMDKGTFSDFEVKVRDAAQKHGIKNPRMLIDIKFKNDKASEFGVTEQPYPIADNEWDQFIRDAKTMTEYMPRVFVVDGDKYTALS